MSDQRIGPTRTEAENGRAFASKWERRYQYAKRGPALLQRWPKAASPTVGVSGGGAGIATGEPVVGGATAIVVGILAGLRELATSSDWDQRHLYHEGRRQAYESIAVEIQQRSASNRAITEREIEQWNSRLGLLRHSIYEQPDTWVKEP